MASRAVVVGVALLGSLIVSVFIYLLTDWLFVFLFLPIVPFLLGRSDDSDRDRSTGGAPPGRVPSSEERTVLTCPECGFQTTDTDHRYCPRDGTPLD